jgi:hypothetical protein
MEIEINAARIIFLAEGSAVADLMKVGRADF